MPRRPRAMFNATCSPGHLARCAAKPQGYQTTDVTTLLIRLLPRRANTIPPRPFKPRMAPKRAKYFYTRMLTR
eukprot:11225472-Lingulodinium_polyedra.AAC.1